MCWQSRCPPFMYADKKSFILNEDACKVRDRKEDVGSFYSFLSSATTIASILLTFGYVHSYERFQLKVPNGEMVPHPCKPNILWRGVGHNNHLGGGARNPFGVDFKNNKHEWTLSLCQKDSDRDGKTNGEELGDPACIWTPGTKPASSLRLSHPGICDPFDNPLCNGKPDFVDCKHKEFECDALSEEGVFNFTVRLPWTPVPAVETTYLCMNFRFPTDQAQEYHLVANTPYIDNKDIMHHMVVFGCEGEVNVTFNEIYKCGMAMEKCTDIVGVWTVGSPGSCNHKGTGYLISRTRGYHSGILQFHWNNPGEIKNYTDSSGMTFYGNSKLRPNHAGMMIIGQAALQIPPGLHAHEEHGGCSRQCLSQYLTGDVTITTVSNHMHYLGKAQFTTLQRNKETVDLAMDETFSYDSPVTHVYKDGVVLRPGDELLTTCVYKSTSRTTTTFFGERTQDEMCMSFIEYFPKENMKNKVCAKALDVDTCMFSNGYAYGCNLTVRANQSDPQTAAISSGVTEYCSQGVCRSECLAYVREVKKNPCYSGNLGKIWKQFSLKLDPTVVSWYAAFDSCDAELALEQCEAGNKNKATIVV